MDEIVVVALSRLPVPASLRSPCCPGRNTSGSYCYCSLIRSPLSLPYSRSPCCPGHNTCGSYCYCSWIRSPLSLPYSRSPCSVLPGSPGHDMSCSYCYCTAVGWVLSAHKLLLHESDSEVAAASGDSLSQCCLQIAVTNQSAGDAMDSSVYSRRSPSTFIVSCQAGTSNGAFERSTNESIPRTPIAWNVFQIPQLREKNVHFLRISGI